MRFILKKIKIVLVTIVLLLGSTSHSNGQMDVFSGPNYCFVRNSVLQNEEPMYAWHFGSGVNFYPFKYWSKFSIKMNLQFSQKGYKQYANEWYTFHFQYFSYQVLGNYTPIPSISLHAGIDLSSLLDTNLEQGVTTYNNFDGGIVMGVSFFDHKRIGLYTRLIYGLTSMLDYYTIDHLGNFTGEIKDLKNTSILIGVKINVYNKKISL